MTQIFFRFLGEYASRLIGFYRDNQTWLNLIIATYGVLLAMAHRNIVRIESVLREMYGSEKIPEILRRIESGAFGEEDLKMLRGRLRVPILASPYHFFFYSVSTKSIVSILKKKYSKEE